MAVRALSYATSVAAGDAEGAGAHVHSAAIATEVHRHSDQRDGLLVHGVARLMERRAGDTGRGWWSSVVDEPRAVTG